MDFSWKRELLEKITDSGELTEELRNYISEMSRRTWKNYFGWMRVSSSACFVGYANAWSFQ